MFSAAACSVSSHTPSASKVTSKSMATLVRRPMMKKLRAGILGQQRDTPKRGLPMHEVEHSEMKRQEKKASSQLLSLVEGGTWDRVRQKLLRIRRVRFFFALRHALHLSMHRIKKRRQALIERRGECKPPEPRRTPDCTLPCIAWGSAYTTRGNAHTLLDRACKRADKCWGVGGRRTLGMVLTSMCSSVCRATASMARMMAEVTMMSALMYTMTSATEACVLGRGNKGKAAGGEGQTGSTQGSAKG